MLFDDTYKQIESDSIGVYREQGSKFIAYAYLVNNKEQIQKKINDIKRVEKSAHHYCYAYVLYPDKSDFRIYDDGEPSSTAGKPILAQIKSNDLTNILIIVVRYFGGKKLGIQGLIRSYKTAASEAIYKAKIIKKSIQDQYQITFKYSELNKIMKVIKNLNLNVQKKSIDVDCVIIVLISRTQTDRALNIFNQNKFVNIKYQRTI